MSISRLAMLAKKTIEAAWLSAPAYDLATIAAEALESAQLLQSPETALEIARLGPDRLTRTFAPTQALREDQVEESALTIYRAQWDSVALGWYTTDRAARDHCEAHARRDMPTVTLDWIEDEEDGVAELVASIGENKRPTGYVVTAQEIASEYDPEADE